MIRHFLSERQQVKLDSIPHKEKQRMRHLMYAILISYALLASAIIFNKDIPWLVLIILFIVGFFCTTTYVNLCWKLKRQLEEMDK